MSYSKLHRAFAIAMALLVLTTSMGVSMDLHYCQNHLVSISFFGKAKCCGNMSKKTPCHPSKRSCMDKQDSESQFDKKGCCHNETIVFEKSDLLATDAEITIAQDFQFEFVAAFVLTFVLNTNVLSEAYLPYELYKPPLPDRDRQVLYQTFLI